MIHKYKKMDIDQLKNRYKQFAIQVILFSKGLPKGTEYRTIQGQMIRSSTSTGANYRAACRGKSKADFINKMKIVEEEMDETMYWLEILASLLPDSKEKVTPIWKEANELLAITVASIKTARSN
jgi:four helix bundle protein